MPACRLPRAARVPEHTPLHNYLDCKRRVPRTVAREEWHAADMRAEDVLPVR